MEAMGVTNISMTSANLVKYHLVNQKPFNKAVAPLSTLSGLGLFRHQKKQQPHKTLLISQSTNKADELAAMQNFKSGLDDALKAAAAKAAAEAAAADADGEADLTSLEGPTFWSTIKSLPPTQLAIVLCYTNKCIPCKAAKPIIIQWVKEKGAKVVGFKFALTLPNKDVALAMGVRTSPVFLFFKNGELIKEIRGGKELQLVKEFMDQNS
ncbi:putative Thioredoxin F, chloroplastic [Nannochloris sp. 'desiccata']|nr:putative Thioredoxin F, chloroplastic [Chlorella desiccata (nom. nud.)]